MRRYEPPSEEEVALEKYVSHCHDVLLKNEILMEYLQGNLRGLTPESITRARLGFCSSKEMYPPTEADVKLKLAYDNGKWVLDNRIVIPYISDGIIVKVRGRINPSTESDRKYLDCPGAQKLPYIPQTIDPKEEVLVCESEFSALLAVQNGIQAIGVPGAGSWEKSWFKNLTNIFLSFDGDDGGREGMTKFAQEVPEFRRVDLPEGFDVTEYLVSFGVDSFRKLLDNAVLYLNKRPQKDDRFDKIVEDFSSWAWTNGSLLGPKISWAPRLEEMLSGWAPGLILIGAEASSGKSTMLVKSLYELCQENDNVLGVYLSLDDTWKEAMLRMVSLHAGIDFNEVRSPRHSFDNPDDSSRRNLDKLAHFNASLESLKDLKKNLVLRDITYGRSLSYLRNFFAMLRAKYPQRRIVVFIDSLALISSEQADQDESEGSTKMNWKAYLASELKLLCTKYNLCVVTPTDLRKINNVWQYPTKADLKDAAELDYEANAIILITNMYMKLKDKTPQDLMWYDDESNKHKPIIRLDIAKNKLTGKRGLIHMYFDDELCNFSEATEDQSREIEMAHDTAKSEYFKKFKEVKQ